MTYRISLRSSSLWEPRHPLLKVMITLSILAHTPREECAGPPTTFFFVIRFNCLNHFRWLQKDSNGLNTSPSTGGMEKMVFQFVHGTMINPQPVRRRTDIN